MRVVAVGLFLVTFAVGTWAIRDPEPTDLTTWPVVSAGSGGERTGSVRSETTRAIEAAKPVAESPPRTESPFVFPAGAKAMAVRAVVSDELVGKLTRGTKVDVLLPPGGPVAVGPPELILAGAYYLPHSLIGPLKAKPGEAQPDELVTIAVTDEQAERLAAADVRGRFLIVPTK